MRDERQRHASKCPNRPVPCLFHEDGHESCKWQGIGYGCDLGAHLKRTHKVLSKALYWRHERDFPFRPDVIQVLCVTLTRGSRAKIRTPEVYVICAPVRPDPNGNSPSCGSLIKFACVSFQSSGFSQVPVDGLRLTSSYRSPSRPSVELVLPLQLLPKGTPEPLKWTSALESEFFVAEPSKLPCFTFQFLKVDANESVDSLARKKKRKPSPEELSSSSKKRKTASSERE